MLSVIIKDVYLLGLQNFKEINQKTQRKGFFKIEPNTNIIVILKLNKKIIEYTKIKSRIVCNSKGCLLAYSRKC